MRTSSEIREEITKRLGFFPPFFAPALPNPQILENLWQQTLSAYVENPLPALFKEKLAAILALSCSIPYCLICHSCTLRPLGMKATEVLELLELWRGADPTEKLRSLEILRSSSTETACWPEAGSAVEQAILHLATLIFSGDEQLNILNTAIVRVVGKTHFEFLCLFIAYNKTSLLWAETHSQELTFEADQRAKDNLKPLIEEEPGLAAFFANYRHYLAKASSNAELHRELSYQKVHENRFTVLIEAIPLIVFTATPDGTIDFRNRHYFEYTGQTTDQVAKAGVEPVMHPDDFINRTKKWAHSIKTGEEYRIEYRIKRKSDAAYRWHLGLAVPLKDEKGAIIKWFGTCSDIHEQKLAADRIRESEAKFKYIYDYGMFGMMFWKSSGEITDANERLLKSLGYTKEDLQGGKLTWHGQTPPEFSYLDKNAMVQLERNGFCEPYEKEIFRKDGSRLPVLVGVSMLDRASNSGLCSVVDLSEKKNSERAIKDSQTRLETVLNHAPVILWATDQNGTVTYSEGSGLSSLGLQPGQLIGQSVFELYKDQTESLHSLKRALAGESFNTETSTGDLHFDSHYAPLHGQDGKVIGVVSLSTDVSAKKNADTARAAALLGEATAKEASRMKSGFLATMSHEIRTPIHGVIGMTTLLLDTPLNDEQLRYASAVKSCADTLLTLINDILDLSKAEAGKLDLESVSFGVEPLIRDVETVLGFTLKRKNLAFSKFLSPEVPENLQGDPTRFRQILMNLLNNAVKFTAQGRISVLVLLDEGEGPKRSLRVEVADTGIGISKEAISRLFLPFSQADSTTTRRYGGSGLGLSICKHLVDSMGGTIGVKSEEGKGSTFWFTFPVETGVAEGKAGSRSLPLVDRDENLRILIAEDIEVNQIITVKMLEKMGHTVVVAVNGQKALEALGQSTYDLVFMDCQMPELDGYEATRRIRASHGCPFRDIPVIAMTAHAMGGDAAKCIAAGMNDYISKPMKIKDLAAAIERALHSRRKAA